MASSRETIRVTLEIDRNAEPLAGYVEDAHGKRRTFVGWTRLAAALSQLLDDADRGRPQRSERDDRDPPL